jgi:hypothetical protein
MTFHIRLAFTSGLALRIKGAAYFTKYQRLETNNRVNPNKKASLSHTKKMLNRPPATLATVAKACQGGQVHWANVAVACAVGERGRAACSEVPCAGLADFTRW